MIGAAAAGALSALRLSLVLTAAWYTAGAALHVGLRIGGWLA